MTLLTQATDVFAAAETGDRSVVVFLVRRQVGAAAVVGSREFATVGGLDPGAGRAWGIVALQEWNDAWCATSAEAPP